MVACGEAFMWRLRFSSWSQAGLSPIFLQNNQGTLRKSLTINFILLRSPLVALHDPETVIVSRERRLMSIDFLHMLIPSILETLSARPSFSEILWSFSRLEGRARITLEQNPHFYSSLPEDESAFTPIFTFQPLGDLSVLKPRDTVYVLVDKPGCVFVQSKGEMRRFGNVWALNGTLIFKGLCPLVSRPLHSDAFPDRTGVLDGEQSIRRFNVQASLRYSESLPRLNHSLLRPIMTKPLDDLASWTLNDWTVLGHPGSCSNIYIYDTQDAHWLSKPSSFEDEVRVDASGTPHDTHHPIIGHIPSSANNRTTRVPCTIYDHRKT